MKNNQRRTVRALTLSAMLVAMSVVIGIFCKTFLNLGGGLFRITFENMPIILSSIIFGPWVGAAVGVAADLISYLLSPQIYPPNLVVTLGAAVIGITAGFVARITKRRGRTYQIILSSAAAHILGSMIIKSFGLFQYYGWAVAFRIPTYIGICTLEALILSLLFRNRTFASLADDIEGGRGK